MTAAELVRISCDRCPWVIEDDPTTAGEARSEHAYAHIRAGHSPTFTEITIEAEQPVFSNDTHTHKESSGR